MCREIKYQKKNPMYLIPTAEVAVLHFTKKTILKNEIFKGKSEEIRNGDRINEYPREYIFDHIYYFLNNPNNYEFLSNL